MAPTHHIVTSDHAQTRRAGMLLARSCRAGDVIALSGGLGAGKTAFVQGLAEGLGVSDHVPSPTFNILLVHRGTLPLYHFDLYRLERPEQLEDIDFYETLESDGISAIEWADNFPEELPEDRLDMCIEVVDVSTRIIHTTGHGPRAEVLAAEWAEAWSTAEGGAQ